MEKPGKGTGYPFSGTVLLTVFSGTVPQNLWRFQNPGRRRNFRHHPFLHFLGQKTRADYSSGLAKPRDVGGLGLGSYQNFGFKTFFARFSSVALHRPDIVFSRSGEHTPHNDGEREMWVSGWQGEKSGCPGCHAGQEAGQCS